MGHPYQKKRQNKICSSTTVFMNSELGGEIANVLITNSVNMNRYSQKDGFSIDRGEYVYNWDDSEYRHDDEVGRMPQFFI